MYPQITQIDYAGGLRRFQLTEFAVLTSL